MALLRSIVILMSVGALGAAAHLAPVLLSSSLTDPSLAGAYIGLLGTLILVTFSFVAWTKTQSWYRAIGVGFLIAFGYFATAFHWLGESVVLDPSTYPFNAGLTALGAWTLLYPWWAAALGTAYLLCSVLRIDKASVGGAISFALSFSVADVLLGDFAFRIPLGAIGSSVLDTIWHPFLTVAGIHGTSAALALFGALLGLTAHTRAKNGPLGLLVALCVLTAPLVAPAAREDASPLGSSQVFLAQPNPPTPFEVQSGLVPDPIESELALVIASIEAGRGAELIVLPEMALRRDLTAEPELVGQLASHLDPGSTLVLGFPRAEVITGDDGSFEVNPYNTAYLISADGRVAAAYDKTHLVPFGEYMPQIFYRMGFTVIAGPPTGLNAGNSLDVFQVPGFAPFSLLICYEALLSGPVSRETNGADWMLNISSEGLFGQTIGPRLLLHYARVRAAETGLPMLRSASTGFTAVIDSRGDVLQALEGQTRGGLLATPPVSKPTLFRAIGYLPLYLVWLAGLCTIIFASKTRRTQHQPKLAEA